MASRTIHDKIPHNVRVNKETTLSQDALRNMYKTSARANRRAAGQDAVTPSVKGLQGVNPSTIGIAAQARFAELAKVASVAKDGLSAIMAIRDSAEAQANPAALANNTTFMAVIQRVIAKIGEEVDELTSGAANEGATKSSLTRHRMTQEERVHRSQAHVAAGTDSACPILGAADMARVERARAKLSRLKTAQAMGDTGDIVRAAFNMEPRAVDADELYAMFEGKRSK
jgi:hypothetical protein